MLKETAVRVHSHFVFFSEQTCFIFGVKNLLLSAHWAETDYSLSAGQHAGLPECKGNLLLFNRFGFLLNVAH